MAAEAGGDIRAGIGTRLRAAREKKSLTILQAAEKMHVDARTLESLEAEDFAALGAPVYARGHLRHYAELVGESPTELQQLYADSTKAAPAQPDLTRIARAEPVSDSGKLVGPAVIGLVAVGVIGVVWWVFTLSVADKVRPTGVHSKLESNTAGAVQAQPVAADTDADADDDTPPPEPAPESAPRGAKNGVGAGAKAGASASATSNAKSVAGNGAAGPAAQSGAKLTTGTATPGTKGAQPPATKLAAATNAASASAAKNSAASASPAAVAATATGGTAAAPIPVANVAAPPPAARAKDDELTLKFSADSWAEVYDATGQRLFYDVGAAASAHTMRGPAPLRVILGNASGVAVEFNGRPALIPAGVQADGSTRFVINAHGRTVPASPASDGD
jgi:cytoskeleton protein RodZ